MGMFREQGGLTGTITGYAFDIKEWPADKKKGKEAYSTLSVELNILPDGATVATKRFLNGGFVYEGQTVSEDKLTLESEDDGAIISGNTEVARFIGSLVEAGFDEALFDGTGRNFEPIIGQRFELKSWVDKEKTAKFGKRVDKKDKTKSYNRTELRVGRVLEAAPVVAAKGGKKAAAAAPKAAAKGKKTEAVDTTQAKDAIIEILSNATNNAIKKADVGSLVVRYQLANKLDKAVRESLKAQLTDDAVLAALVEEGVIEFDGKVISLA